MGMGDIPIPYTPNHNLVRDDVIGREFVACATRSCPHPAVIQRYGVGGVANVSIYTCRRCRHKVANKFDGGLACELELSPGAAG